MSKPRNAEWLRHQAQARQAARAALLARQGEKDVAQQQAKEVLQKLISQTLGQQQRLARLAPVFADRCVRVRELCGLYRAEWERAERLQAENAVLLRRVAELNGGVCDGAGDEPALGRHAAGLAGVCGNGDGETVVVAPPVVP